MSARAGEIWCGSAGLGKLGCFPSPAQETMRSAVTFAVDLLLRL